MAETPLEDLPLGELRRLYDEALSAARAASAAEAALYREHRGSPVERTLAGQERRASWAQANLILAAIGKVRREGEAIQVRGDLL